MLFLCGFVVFGDGVLVGAKTLDDMMATNGSSVAYDLYNIGDPVFTDLYVSVNGRDSNNGRTRRTPLETLGAAWSRIPGAPLNTKGYRINLLPGTYPCEGDCQNFFADRIGTYKHPIMIRAVDGPGTVTLLGGLNLFNVGYLYLVDLTLWAGSEAGASFGNNVLHLEKGDHVLLRGLTLRGPVKFIDDARNDMQEVLKVNQSQYVYLELSDLSGTFQTVLDYVSSQHGHILYNRIHRAGGRCAYLKGGSAYFVASGNELYDCREAGFQVGESTNIAFMRPPWLHYEAYDVKIVNNVIHEIYGAGMAVHGSYNVLMAHNTCYKIGLDDAAGRTSHLFRLDHGGRSCISAEEFGGDEGTRAQCREQLNQGGWGTAVLGEDAGGFWIPNRNVYIFNNIFYNPSATGTRYGQIAVNGPIHPAQSTRNIPDPSATDTGALICGNLIWNHPIDDPILINTTNGSEPGCRPSNPTCTESQIHADNMINEVEPQFIDPARGNFHPVAGGTIHEATTYAVPAFKGGDTPSPPPVNAGALNNSVPVDCDGKNRTTTRVVGAFTTQGATAASFSATPTIGRAPLRVRFTDKSTGHISVWSWNFGDGTPRSNAKNPIHTFKKAGRYTVTLTISSPGSTVKRVKKAYIRVSR
jgi:hypothetical protein